MGLDGKLPLGEVVHVPSRGLRPKISENGSPGGSRNRNKDLDIDIFDGTVVEA